MTIDAVTLNSLAGRRVLVVGAGTQPTDDPDAPTGNGRAIAVAAAKAGAMVACADRDGDAAEETVRQIVDGGGSGVSVVADVSDADSCAELIDSSAELLAGIDGLVLNVGIGLGAGWLTGTTAHQWDTVFAVNVRSHFLLCQAALGRMEAGSSIVFISSVAGLRPGSRLPAYDSSKAAIAGLCRHVAFEGSRRGVRANVIAPGLIDTPLGRRATKGRPSRSAAGVPMGREGTAWEIAAPAVFLLSDAASYLTGQVIAVDGGLTMA